MCINTEGICSAQLLVILLAFETVKDKLELPVVETKTNLMRKTKAVYSECCDDKGISHCHLCFAETRESFIEETREGSRCALIGGPWPGGPVGGPGRSGVLSDWLEYISGFHWLALSWK